MRGHSVASQDKSAGARSLAAAIVKAFLFLAVLLFVGRALYRNLAGLDWQEVHFRGGFLLLAVAATLIAKSAHVLTYRLLVAGFCRPPGWLPLTGIAWLPEIGKYLPGKVAGMLGAVWLLRRHRVPAPAAISTVYLANGLWVVIGLLVGTPLILLESVRASLPLVWLWAPAAVLAGAACLHPGVFGPVGNYLLRKFSREPVLSPPRARHYAGPAGIIAAQWCLSGIGFWFLARSLNGASAAQLPFYVAALAFASSVGFVAFFAPGRLGVQEGFLLLVLTPVAGSGTAAVVTVALRLVQVLADVLLAGLGALALWRPARAGAPPDISCGGRDLRREARPHTGSAQMKIVVDVNHPAHVHFFKNFVRLARAGGHQVLITATHKDVTHDLLAACGFSSVDLGRYGAAPSSKLISLPKITYRMYRAVRPFDPDLLLGIASVRAAHVSFLLRKRCILFDDTEHAKETSTLYLPFVNAVCTPACFKADLGAKQVRYEGYHELAYLHPNQFQPDESALRRAGLREDEPFVVVRFISWGAMHDLGQSGFGQSARVRLIRELEEYGRVLLSAEGPVDPRLERHRIQGPPEDMHHLLHFARLYVGEGATMATEAAILGTPSVYVSSLVGTMGNFDELMNRYGLVLAYRSPAAAEQKALQLVQDADARERWLRKRDDMLADKIDVTRWMTDLILGQSEPARLRRAERGRRPHWVKLAPYRSRVTPYRKKCAMRLRGRVLDCGGGVGAYLPYLDGDVTVLGDCENMPFPDNAFDNVWACAMAQFVRLDVFIREAIRVTRPGGHVMVLVPNARSPWDRIKRLFGMGTWWDQKGIVTQYSVDDLRRYGRVTGEVQFLPFEALFRHLPRLGHTLMLDVRVEKQVSA